MKTAAGPDLTRRVRPERQLSEGISIMKKTLCALAVLGAFAGTSLAADVTLYGIVDEGLLYTNIDQDTGNGSVDKLELKSGVQGSSRFGFKGVEEIGNGLKVGFKLENAFSADDGQLSEGGRLVHREAQVNLSGAFGTIALGRMGGVGSSVGTFDLVYESVK